ncbi:MAG: hypothetical protein WC879_09120 [Melioribacteraceae bacterium]
MKYKSILLSILLLLTISTVSFSQEAETNSKTTSVFIMPLTRDVQNYNFSLDRERLRLVSMFSSLGFNVVEDATTWDKITKFDYDLANLSKKMLNKLSDAVDVDLIVYKNLDRIRVYDCNKKSFVNFEMKQPYTSSQYVAQRLKQIGY